MLEAREEQQNSALNQGDRICKGVCKKCRLKLSDKKASCSKSPLNDGIHLKTEKNHFGFKSLIQSETHAITE